MSALVVVHHRHSSTPTAVNKHARAPLRSAVVLQEQIDSTGKELEQLKHNVANGDEQLGENIESLKLEVISLTGTIGMTNGSVEMLKGDLSGLQGDFAEQVTVLTSATNSIEAHLIDRTDMMATNFDAKLTGATDGMNANLIDRTDTMATSFDAKLTSIKRKLDKIMALVAARTDRIVKLEQDVPKLETKFENMNAVMEKFSDRLDSMEVFKSSATSQFTLIGRQHFELQNANRHLCSRMGGVVNELRRVNQIINAHGEKLLKHDMEISKISNRQAAVESYVVKRVELEVTFNRERASAKKKFDAMLEAELVDVATKLNQDNIDTATHLGLDLIPIPVLDEAVGSI